MSGSEGVDAYVDSELPDLRGGPDQLPMLQDGAFGVLEPQLAGW